MASKPSSPDSKQESTKAKASIATDFNPDTITLQTFRTLLSHYPQTLKQVHQNKLVQKLQPKPKKGAKTNNCATPQTELSPTQKEHIKAEVEKFVTLDRWRYEGRPELLVRGKASEKVLNKEDLISIMQWKTTHGKYRPMLMGMIKANDEKLIIKCTESASSSLPNANSKLDLGSDSDLFPQKSLDALQPLRGVGVATASLILSIATGFREDHEQVPFYSDDLFLWLVVGEYPVTGLSEKGDSKSKSKSKFMRDGELNVKYNLNEYRELWGRCRELMRRLKIHEGYEEDPISQNDIEKVAYVLRNIGASGLYDSTGTEVGKEVDVFAEESRKRKREGTTEKNVVKRASRSATKAKAME
ncbi:hypothetical protein N7520_000472 [Penicillium odoratum]|uniref:uncharacterized protein n=1 Tax=Penicillium odoratum TaxID=1167516 RepID=UPI002546E2A3|nr:uncharacterized protein N7520_000472 [Penicillium odoratum]KAJ5777226.1 hypothetical protein N7520_000472 [Penicillium odoratum]